MHSLVRSLTYSLLIAGGLASVATGLTAQVRREFTEIHMGMPVRVVLHAADDDVARTAAAAAFRRIVELEDIFSDYRASSELRRLEPQAGNWVRVSEPLFEVLQRALDIAELTDGAFDPTVGPLVGLWREARRTRTLPDSAAVDSARHLTGWQLLRLDRTTRSVRLDRTGMRLDLGGVAKGYILQSALSALDEHHVAAALVEAGGDIVTGAPPPGRQGWNVDAPGAAAGFRAHAASLSHAALSSSGSSFQHFAVNGTRYSHIIDPRTGLGVTHTDIVRVIAPDAVLADALATALSVAPGLADRITQRFPHIEIDITRAAH